MWPTNFATEVHSMKKNASLTRPSLWRKAAAQRSEPQSAGDTSTFGTTIWASAFPRARRSRCGDYRTRSDPSRKYPGDVCIRSAAVADKWGKASFHREYDITQYSHSFLFQGSSRATSRETLSG